MPSVIVIGGGLAGLASAAALGQSGFQVDLFEARGFLGGRATSYPVPGDNSEVIDNCQHVLLRCCVNLMDFYRRLEWRSESSFTSNFSLLNLAAGLRFCRPADFQRHCTFAGSFRD